MSLAPQHLHRTFWCALALAVPTAASAEDRCAALAAATLEDVTIERATLQPEGLPVAGASIPDPTGGPDATPVSGLPAFCRVIGSAKPEAGSDIRFEVWLPREKWTGRFTGGANGGFAGYVSYGDLAAAVTAGHAGASTDTGHTDPTSMDASWAQGRPERVRDYGWRAIHVTTVVAKKLIAAYYGRGPDHSYFIGCSNGGRQGLIEASRFPEDYDGIIAGAPPGHFTALGSAFISVVHAQTPKGAALRPDQMARLQSEVLKQCDARDGQADGLVSEPLRCSFDAAQLACGKNATAECFTPPQLEALATIMGGRRNRDGRTVAYGFPPSGVEGGPLGWGAWLTAGQEMPSGQAVFARGQLEGLVQKPTSTVETFDFEGDLQAFEDAVSADVNAEPRLRAFFARGGKLILWQGWGDGAVPAGQTLAFHDAIERDAGPLASDALRLFMVPGVQHCSGGAGPDLLGQEGATRPGATPERNLGAALEAWVERGRAPESLIGGFSSDATRQRERLVCAYPKRAVLNAGQDPNKGASYACRD
ncbi:MAG: tannase/feruloyl esterase family alpha/beta hydrolase [Polyangiales bacterium]